MANLLNNLREKLHGEVEVDAHTREYFSTDCSIFQVAPKVVIYPRNENDVIETLRFNNNLYGSGKALPVTARGKGTDLGGASLSEGISLVLPTHMRRLVNITKETITVQPGMIYAHLQSILHSHNSFLPPYPASIDFCSIGGAIANNASGEKTIKYGDTRNYVAGLRIVLHNGDVIETRRLSKKELEQKKRQQDLEGELYNYIDNMIDQNWDLIASSKPNVSKNSAGYALWDVKRSDGSFDLGQLFVGNQGTLGIITEAMLYHMPYNPHTTLVVGHFEDAQQLQQAVAQIVPLGPSALEMVDRSVIDFVVQNRPQVISSLLPEKIPESVLFVEFDDLKVRTQHKQAEKALKILQHHAYETKYTSNRLEQDQLWRIGRQSTSMVWTQKGAKKALPVIEDGVVPLENFSKLTEQAHALLSKHGVKYATWGHVGNGHLRIQPFLDLGNLRDRQKIYTIADNFYKIVLKLGGSIAGEHNDGIMRGVYLRKMFDPEMIKLFMQVKKIFDPHNLLNPNSKLGATKEYGTVHMRKEYSMKHMFEHMPGVSSSY